MPACRQLLVLLATLQTVGSLSLAFAQPSKKASIHEAFNWSQRYLQSYHPDFATLQLQKNHANQCWQVADASGTVLLFLPSEGDEITHKVIFHALASLLLDPATPTLSPDTSLAIKNAWYWDSRVQDQAAWLAWLSPWDPDSRLAPRREKEAFWRFRWLIRTHGGRQSSWRAAQRAPALLDQLRFDVPMPLQQHMELLEFAGAMTHPVMGIEQSLAWLRGMDTFHFSVEPAGTIRELHLSDLQQVHRSSQIIADMRTRLQWIKRELPRINPAFHNAFHSLGLCFELVLSGDDEAFALAVQAYQEDSAFAEAITRHIRTPPLTRRP
jgi:hypothetical protein